METHTIGLADKENAEMSLTTLIADEPHERAAGYQHICPKVVAETAILFLFPNTINSRFHMRNVYAPLDIVFFDADGYAVDVLRMRAEPPGSPVMPRLYQSGSPFRFALELPAEYLSYNAIDGKTLRLLLDTLPDVYSQQ